MVYFKAIELVEKPFIQWDSVAFSLLELQELKLEDDPLILEEIKVPNFIYGVCPLKIEKGELVKRSLQEMTIFENEFFKNQEITKLKFARNELENLFYEPQFTKGIYEDTKDLEALYKAKFREYNDLKEA
jgi:hypothetical protein